jgi:hypothetical protein
VRKTHDYIHHYRGYWSEGDRCLIRIHQEDGQTPVVVCSQPSDNPNTSLTNMAEYLAAEVIEAHSLPTPLTWIEHYPEHQGDLGEWSLVRFASWKIERLTSEECGTTGKSPTFSMRRTAQVQAGHPCHDEPERDQLYGGYRLPEPQDAHRRYDGYPQAGPYRVSEAQVHLLEGEAQHPQAQPVEDEDQHRREQPGEAPRELHAGGAHHLRYYRQYQIKHYFPQSGICCPAHDIRSDENGPGLKANESPTHSGWRGVSAGRAFRAG